MKHIFIIGNGISGITTARYIRKQNPEIKITVIGNETDYFYARTALMYLYMGHLQFNDTKPYEDGFWKKNRISLVKGDVVSLRPEDRKFLLADGRSFVFDQLVIASGSKPLMANWPGETLSGIQGFYGMNDLALLEENTQNIRNTTVIGGGLIGIELAEMLHTRGLYVTFLVREGRYMERILPPEESELVHQEIRRNGICLQLNTAVKAFHADRNGRVSKVETTTGQEIPTQLACISIGVTPNIDWLNGSGVNTRRGVLVDAHFQTNFPNIFAVGDCAEFQNPLPGQRPLEQLWYTGKMHGEVLGKVLGGGKAMYQKGVFFNSAKFFDMEYQVYGDVTPDVPAGVQEVFWQHPHDHKSIRIRYNATTGSVIGFLVMGIRFRQQACQEWIRRKTPIKEVLTNLKMAFFDPEFFDTFGTEVREVYKAATGKPWTMPSIPKRTFWPFYRPK